MPKSASGVSHKSTPNIGVMMSIEWEIPFWGVWVGDFIMQADALSPHVCVTEWQCHRTTMVIDQVHYPMDVIEIDDTMINTDQDPPEFPEVSERERKNKSGDDVYCHCCPS